MNRTKLPICIGTAEIQCFVSRALPNFQQRQQLPRTARKLLSSATFFQQYADSELGNKAAEGAGVGGAIGGTVGAIAAAIAAIGTSLVLPGLGLVIAGPIAAALAGAGAGAGAAGGG